MLIGMNHDWHALLTLVEAAAHFARASAHDESPAAAASGARRADWAAVACPHVGSRASFTAGTRNDSARTSDSSPNDDPSAS